jgi:hypothetical protein
MSEEQEGYKGASAADGLSFENCAADVAKMLGKSVAAALDLANAYQRNLGWDEKKLFARAQDKARGQ